ncbi:MAG TPA: nicotinic acid mononucleotide adenylyltransferase [Firmicutes bacterium]|nr:nicotinic acid mononucleotide adenylyltransferase [Bacillota bacterium]
MAGFGILGGTFDPIHVGHLFLAEKSREAFNLSKVIFVPASIPPHKIGEVTLPVNERLKMVEMAIQNHSQFQVSKVEIERVGPSYSIDTIRELKSQCPGEDCFFILGFDSLLGLNTWKNYRQILDETQLIAALRPGFPILQYDQDWPDFLKSYRQRIHILKAPLIDISATWLRNELKLGRSIRYLVPDVVSEYIDQRQLYRNQLKV